MAIDIDYHNRLLLLAELIIAHPYKRMTALQWAAIREYPVQSKELTRHLFSKHYASLALDIIVKRIMKEVNSE